LNTLGDKKKSLVLCGPSAVGKTTLIDLFQTRNPLYLEPSFYHTRPARKDDKSAHIPISSEEFERRARIGEFICVCDYLGWKYGIPISEIDKLEKSGKRLITDISLRNLHKMVHLRARMDIAFIYIYPSKEELLLDRLILSRPDSDNILQRYDDAKRDLNSRYRQDNWKYIDAEIENRELIETIIKLEEITKG
jgi:guanylate kinase